jgi:hypothetical protein
MSKDDTTSWGEVCKRVTMGDTLYSTCREKVSDYGPGGYAGGALDSFDDADEDFGAQLAGSALPVPPPPPMGKGRKGKGGGRGMALAAFDGGHDDDDDERGGIGGLLDEMNLGKILMYGGVVALVWFLLRKKSQEVVTTTSEPEIKTLDQKPVTATKAA